LPPESKKSQKATWKRWHGMKMGRIFTRDEGQSTGQSASKAREERKLKEVF
jgi:hypothetical protein